MGYNPSGSLIGAMTIHGKFAAKSHRYADPTPSVNLSENRPAGHSLRCHHSNDQLDIEHCY